MNTSTFLTRSSFLMIALVLLSGCKVLDDDVQTDLTGDVTEGTDNGSAPAIWGEPQTSALVGTSYSFQPDASDNDGDVLEFVIENKPAWTTFDKSSGLLQGVPGDQHIGEYGNIIISATDQSSVVSLPSFEIMVHAVANPDDVNASNGDDGGANSPPTIAGTPNKFAVAGSQYAFRPESSDSEGDSLSFSVVNKPAWANFNTTNGRLGGYPSSNDIGTSRPIEISVTDGQSVVALPKFRIEVEGTGSASLTIAWNAPTQNADGSPLTDLDGYRIHYGTSPGDYSDTIELNSPGVTSYVIENLAPGSYFLAMTSVNADNLESDYSAEISFDLGT